MEADDALTKAVEAARLDETANAEVASTQSNSTVQKIESLFNLLRLPPELAAVAESVGDAPACIGRYPVVQLLGSGGFGRVVLAYDERLDRQVAIKIAHKADQSLLADAQRAARLKHDGIVTIHAVEATPDGSFFIVMEHLEGGSLAERLKREGKLPPEQAVRLVAEVAQAVQHAHERGFCHRDLKPENILFDADGRPHVVDFGLAVHESRQADRKGEVSGTWAYMAPEQIRGEVPRIDGRTDVWALGVILYELLTGQHPFSGRDRAELTDQIEHREPRPPRQIDPAIPAPVQDVVLKSLAKRPADRYPSAADLGDALRRSLRTPRTMPRVLLLLIGLAVVVAAVPLAVVLQLAMRQSDPGLDPREGNTSEDRLRLDGTVDVLVWRPHNNQILGTLIHNPGVAPLRVGDQYRIEVKLAQPAFAYLVSIDADAKVHVIYPWIPEQGEPRPQHEQSVSRVSSPQNRGAQGWLVTSGSPGTSTILLLARETPLPDGVDLAQLLADAGTVPLRDAQPVVFVNDGQVVSRNDDADQGERASSFAKSEAIDDPLLAFHGRLAAMLKDHFTMIRAVSYADLGK